MIMNLTGAYSYKGGFFNTELFLFYFITDERVIGSVGKTNHVGKRKARHIEYDAGGIHGGSKHQAGCFHGKDGVSLDRPLALVGRLVEANANKTYRPAVLVGPVEKALAHAQLLHEFVVPGRDRTALTGSHDTGNLKRNKTKRKKRQTETPMRIREL